MDIRSISVVATKIPWKEIRKAGPVLVAAARLLIEMIKENRRKAENLDEGKSNDVSSTVRQLATQVDALQATDTQQAEIIGQLAEQSKDLSNGLNVLAARVTLLLWLVGAAIVIAVLTLLKGVL